MNASRPKFRLAVVLKVILVILGLPVVLLVLFVLAFTAGVNSINAKGGIDVVKGKPDQAFLRYVLDVIPSGIIVVSAEGRAQPMFGGTRIRFQLEMDKEGLEALIAAKRLERMEVSNPLVFGTNDLTKWKKPEFYSGRAAPPGIPSATWGVSLAVDRETGAAFYSTGGD